MTEKNGTFLPPNGNYTGRHLGCAFHTELVAELVLVPVFEMRGVMGVDAHITAHNPGISRGPGWVP